MTHAIPQRGTRKRSEVEAVVALLPDMRRQPNVLLCICASDHLLRKGTLIKGDALEASEPPADVDTSKSSK